MNEDRKAEARRLREEGVSFRAIATAVGAAQNTVIRWLNPGYKERQYALQRERRAKKKGVCSLCGGPTSYDWRKKAFAIRCQTCQRRPTRGTIVSGKRENETEIPADIVRRVPPPSRPTGDIGAQELLETYDCQAYGCVRDAEPGEQYCRRHLDGTLGAV